MVIFMLNLSFSRGINSRFFALCGRLEFLREVFNIFV